MIKTAFWGSLRYLFANNFTRNVLTMRIKIVIFKIKKGGNFVAQTNINIRMDENLKQQFDRVCNELGLNMTTAFNIFAKTVVRQQRIPFELSLNSPNSETIAAIDDVDNGRNLSRSFHSVSELMEDLNA